MPKHIRSIDQVVMDFSVPNNDTKRSSVLRELLATIPTKDYQAMLDNKLRFTWFIPAIGLASLAFKQPITIFYLSPELEHAANDIVRASVAHELAHLRLSHPAQRVTDDSFINNPVQDRAAWRQVASWGFEPEMRKLKASLKRKKTSESNLAAQLIAESLGELKQPIDSIDYVDEQAMEEIATKPLALIIEDDKDSARLYSRILLPMGYDFKIVPDQESALLQLSETQPQMVILDMSLTKWKRDTAGAVILSKIRQDERLKDTRVVVVTAYSSLADEVANQIEGMLIKPISATKLQDLIIAAA